MKSIIILFSLLFSLISIADELTIEVNPSQPVVGENFSLLFNIETIERDEPYISFNPGTARVVGRSNEGYSSMTSIINGKISIKKTVSYRYVLVAERSGQVRISDIVVDINGTKLNHKDIKLNVLREAPETPDLFVLAVPSKKEAYVGEGVDVYYYLYARANILASQIKEYPKLSDFVKRFQNPNERTETVEYGGKVFYRSAKYVARVYAEKPGKATIDPLKLEINYSLSGRNDFFGMAARNIKQRTLTSKKVEIDIKALPATNVPSNFTGLVGQHEFRLSVPRSKYLVNEAVEARLEVTGEGALETFNAPQLYKSEFLEEFDTKSEITPVNDQVVRKVFEYTLLARNKVQLPKRVETFYYFDPNGERYVGVDVEIPEVEVGGSATSSINKNRPTPAQNQNIQAPSVVKDSPISLLAPTFIENEKKSINIEMKIVNLLLALTIALLVLSMIKIDVVKMPSDIEGHYGALKKGRFTHTDIFQVLSKLNEEVGVNAKIDASSMTDESKKYFKNLYKGIEQEVYKNHKNLLTSKIKKKHLKALEKELKA